MRVRRTPVEGRVHRTGSAAPSPRNARRVNETLRAAADVVAVPIAFFCECGDPTCSEAVWLTGAEYDRARSDSEWVLLHPDHDAAHLPLSAELEHADGAEFDPLDLVARRGSLDEALRGVPFS